MDTEKPRLGAGDVRITLLKEDGTPEELVLRPSYNAARMLSAGSEGLMKLMQRVVAGDVEAAASIVSHGLGYGTGSNRGPKDLAERVWRTGLSDESGGLAERCIMYLRVLMAGGRLPASADAGADDGSDPQ